MPIGKFLQNLYTVDRVFVLKYIIVQLSYPFKSFQIRTWNAWYGINHCANVDGLIVGSVHNPARNSDKRNRH